MMPIGTYILGREHNIHPVGKVLVGVLVRLTTCKRLTNS